MTVAAIIVAAGRGTRTGSAVPKQYRMLAGRPVLARSLAAFTEHPTIDVVQPVIGGDDGDLYAGAAEDVAPGGKLRAPVIGGATRQASVREGLLALAAREAPAIVLIHDAARPFVGPNLIDRAVEAARRERAAVPGIVPSDTIKIVGGRGEILQTPPRDRLRAVQTPQAFSFDVIHDAHLKAAEVGLDAFTDDGSLAEWAGLAVAVFEGETTNVKLTHESDFEAAERRLARPLAIRVGTGFDVHAFGAGDCLWLAGVRVPSERGVLAHSDGDVALHALTDALLGALADGDIGVHFPPSDPQWRGASSDRFLAFAAERVRGRGGIIEHLDLTILCEAPRIGPYRDAMRQRIAEIVSIPVGSVSVKATTTERLGFIGRTEGLAAQAAATIRLPMQQR